MIYSSNCGLGRKLISLKPQKSRGKLNLAANCAGSSRNLSRAFP